MIENIPDMIDNKVDSLKIEGRMKSGPLRINSCQLLQGCLRCLYGKSRSLYAIKDDDQ